MAISVFNQTLLVYGSRADHPGAGELGNHKEKFKCNLVAVEKVSAIFFFGGKGKMW
uniref:Uncharacterized protein n=1 Tax=Nelumbo nucifera TaxID=4432 RepID=A0A822XFQ6_NELNU|nr:TPA_asm: hypothetical protein HUJ06_020195 [Nelumbo nucifera]